MHTQLHLHCIQQGGWKKSVNEHLPGVGVALTASCLSSFAFLLVNRHDLDTVPYPRSQFYCFETVAQMTHEDVFFLPGSWTILS